MIKETRNKYSEANINSYLAQMTKLLTETNLTVKEIFQSMGATDTPYIRKAFREKFGTTFADYRSQLRYRGVEADMPRVGDRKQYRRSNRTKAGHKVDAMKIAHLLGTTALTIQEIHDHLDISENQHIRAAFKERYHRTYGEYRKAVAKGIIESEKKVFSETDIPGNRSLDYHLQNVLSTAEMLLTTDKTVKDIMSSLNISDPPKLYADFRLQYGCTPIRYREAGGDMSKINPKAKFSGTDDSAGSDADKELNMDDPDKQEFDVNAADANDDNNSSEQPFDFTVVVRQIQQPMVSPGFEYDLSTTLQIPFLINDRYEYRASVLPTSGKCPTLDPYEFLRSENLREKFNEIVVETVRPFYHGQLNIAYMQTLSQPAYGLGMSQFQDRRPGGWSHKGTAQPGFEHGR